MEIRGKEYKFLYTVRASLEISKNLEGHQMSSIMKVFQTKDQIKCMDLIIDMAIAMNRAYLLAEAYDNGTEYDESDLITAEIIETLTMVEENQLETEVMEAMTSGNKNEIETNPVKPAKGSKKNPVKK